MPVTVTVDAKKAKSMAKALAGRLAAMGVNVGHSQALEAVAAVLGASEWNVLAASLGDARTAPASAAEAAEREVREFARSKGVALLGTMHVQSEYLRHWNTRELFPNPDTFAKAVEEYARTAMGPEMAREMLWNEIMDEIDSGGRRELDWHADLLRDREGQSPKPA